MFEPSITSQYRKAILIGRAHRISFIAFLCICIVLGSTVFAQSHQLQAGFSFPGDSNRVHSATGNYWATYKQSSTSQDEYSFLIADGAGNPLVQRTFTRSVEGAWSPYSDQLYLNDFLGSTQVDCLVWVPGNRGLSSLTETLLREPHSGPIEGRGAKPPETPENSRYELTCQGWRAKDKVSVSLEGTTWAGGQYKYKLVYDVQSRKFSWD